MSYLILLVGLYYAMFALANSMAQILNLVVHLQLKRDMQLSFKSSIRYGTISFVLTCLAIYVNHWPKR